MKTFSEKYAELFKSLGESKNMVLATSLNDYVTSRMMSIVIIDYQLYFQTDKSSKKYEQLHKNPNVSLCIDNIQIEGECTEVGAPIDKTLFCALYQKNFPTSYDMYSHLPNERLFCVSPLYIKKWIYRDGQPYEELFSIPQKTYEQKKYM